MAATLACIENDIKRILAYSTLSQLGLMVMALGLGGPLQGMYHLTTHAFFKALLFLGAVLVFVGCATKRGPEPIVVGMQADRTGGISSWGYWIEKAAIAGIESGSTMRRKTMKWFAPST